MNYHPLRFDRASASYDAHSGIQAGMALRLLNLIPEGWTPARVLEMGCGTGHLSIALRERFPECVLAVTDAAPGMLEQARRRLAGIADPKTHASQWNAGALPAPLPAGWKTLHPFDLAASNALVQWFPDLRSHFLLAAAQLASGGRYLVSGFFRNNFPELNALLREPPFGYSDFPGHDWEEIRTAAGDAGFEVEAWSEESLLTTYPSSEAFLSAIRGLGSARRPQEGKPLTRARLRHLTAAYHERYPAGEGVRATWKPWYALLKRDET